MKKSAILEEAHIHDEDEVQYRSHRTSMPKLSYSAAMQSFFISSSGAIHQVETCQAHFIEAFVNAAMQTAKNPDICKRELNGLDYRELIDRWFALNSLRLCKATVPLYATLAEADSANSK